jgi:prepilin-type N-terminal cleavage/methylation domain-containing protein
MVDLNEVFLNEKNKGFTIIELIVVIAILGIISAIAVPRFVGYRSLAVKSACDKNRNTAERLYITFLLENEHRDNKFNQFLIENFNKVCPAGGNTTYEEGNVKCSIHEDESNDVEDDPPSDEVPWL